MTIQNTPSAEKMSVVPSRIACSNDAIGTIQALMPHRVEGQPTMRIVDLNWQMAQEMIRTGVLVPISENLYTLAQEENNQSSCAPQS